MILAFALGFAFTVVLSAALLLVLHKVGLLKSHADVSYRFQAHQELVNGTLDLMRERTELRLEAWKQILDARIKGEVEPIKKDLEDARVGVLNLANRMNGLEGKYEQLMGMSGITGEGRPLPTDMEVVGGGAIGND